MFFMIYKFSIGFQIKRVYYKILHSSNLLCKFIPIMIQYFPSKQDNSLKK